MREDGEGGGVEGLVQGDYAESAEGGAGGQYHVCCIRQYQEAATFTMTPLWYMGESGRLDGAWRGGFRLHIPLDDSYGPCSRWQS